MHPVSDLTAQAARQTELAQQRQKSARLSRLAPEQIAAERGVICPHCGGLRVPVVKEIELPHKGITRPTVLWPRLHGCEEEADYLARQKRAQELEEWRAQMHRAGLTGRLAEATFDSFTERADWTGAMECKHKVMAFMQATLSGETKGKSWLILHGNYGTGKSHLAAAAVRHALAAGRERCYFRNWITYLNRFKATWDRSKRGELQGETEDAIIREVKFGDLVVIDDLDKREYGDYFLSILYDILNDRWNEERPTIITLNYGPQDTEQNGRDPNAPGRLMLERYLGRPVIDRLVDAAFDVVKFDGPSHRSGLKWNAP